MIVLAAEEVSIAADSLNTLLDPFDISLNTTVEFATDQGLNINHEENLNVTDFETHPLLQNISALTWKSGVSLDIDTKNPNTTILATLNFNEISYPVLGLYEGPSSHKGNILVLGTDYLFYDDLINETGSSN